MSCSCPPSTLHIEREDGKIICPGRLVPVSSAHRVAWHAVGALAPLSVVLDANEPNEFTRGWNVGYARGYNAALEKVKELLSAGE